MPKSKVKIRLASVKDAVQLARLYREAYGPVTANQVRRWMKEEAPSETIVAIVDGGIVSSVVIIYLDLLVDGIPIKSGGIAGVATRWAYRRRGLSTRLLREAAKRLKRKGVSNATLFTGRNLVAIRIYTHLGYSEISPWMRYVKFNDPVEIYNKGFEWRSKWIPKTPFGKPILNDWKERVLIDSTDWRATITYDGKKFKVQSGKRGKPSIVMKGDTTTILNCLSNRLVYDESIRRGTLQVTGSPEVCDSWRRMLTLEWVE